MMTETQTRIFLFSPRNAAISHFSVIDIVPALLFAAAMLIEFKCTVVHSCVLHFFLVTFKGWSLTVRIIGTMMTTFFVDPVACRGKNMDTVTSMSYPWTV